METAHILPLFGETPTTAGTVPRPPVEAADFGKITRRSHRKPRFGDATNAPPAGRRPVRCVKAPPREAGSPGPRAARLDKVVGKFARDRVHAAEALFEIRSRRLYRDNHPTFEDYCQEVHVHEMSRNDANRLILAGRIRAEMVPIVTKLGLPPESCDTSTTRTETC